MLVTLDDRHHLDDLMVLWSFLISRWQLCQAQLMVQTVVSDSLCQSSKESTHRDHLILARIKKDQYPCTGAPTRTSGECQLSDTLRNHRHVPYPSPLHLCNYFHVLKFLYIRIIMLD